MCPWLTVEADSLVAGQSVPLIGVPFKLDSADRETQYKGVHPPGPVTLVMPGEYRGESGLWLFHAWENDSTNRTRVVTVDGDVEVKATLYKYRQAAPTPIVQPDYQRKVHYVRLISHPTKAFARLKKKRDYKAVGAQAQLTLFEAKVRDVMDDQGVFSDLRHQYLAYALALDKSQREMAFMVDLIREHRILRDRFERRGLDPTVLDAVDVLVIYRS